MTIHGNLPIEQDLPNDQSSKLSTSEDSRDEPTWSHGHVDGQFSGGKCFVAAGARGYLETYAAEG